MNLKDYKKLGIQHFYQRDYKTAKIFFSLAYEKRKNKKLLHFISLCDFALKSPDEAIVIFDFYMLNYKYEHIYEDLEYILSMSESRQLVEKKLKDDENSALSYSDFLRGVEEIGFKKSFENIIFSTKLVINNKNDFLDFLEKLLENGYEEFILDYLEYISHYFLGDVRFENFTKRLRLKDDYKIQR